MTYTATGFSNPARGLPAEHYRGYTPDHGRTFSDRRHRRRDESHLVERLFLRPIGTSMN